MCTCTKQSYVQEQPCTRCSISIPRRDKLLKPVSQERSFKSAFNMSVGKYEAWKHGDGDKAIHCKQKEKHKQNPKP